MNLKSAKSFAIFMPVALLLLLLLTSPWASEADRSTFLCLILSFWMVLWWVMGILPLGVTALLPIIYLPLLNIFSIKEVAPAYANPVIFLFLGGFMIARALEKTQLDERMALSILKVTGKSDRGILTGFILATAFLSMWISNTATTVMMVPIALSVIHFLEKNLKDTPTRQLMAFSSVLFLAIAYSANIGGIMTPVGTPPNVVFMGYLSELYGREVDFYLWILTTVPVATLLLIAMYFLLVKLFPFSFQLPKEFSKFLKIKIKQIGPLSHHQKITISIFLFTAFLWIFKGVIHYFADFKFLNDTSVAILGGSLLFLIPISEKKSSPEPVLNLKDIGKLPWDIVLLFGGGMALASALKEVGLIEKLTDYLISLPLHDHSYFLVFALSAMALFLTEIMSNVALCVVALPIIMKLGETLGIDPLLMAMPAALCTSFAFSMPISTPPNAIVFGSGRVEISQMLKAGIILNWLALAITMSLGYTLIQFFIL